MKKLNLVYDVSLLQNTWSRGAGRSGIYMVGYNVFNELVKKDDIELFLYIDSESNSFKIIEFLKQFYPNKKFDISINHSQILRTKLKNKKDLYKSEKKNILKFLLQIIMLFLSPLLKFTAKIENKRILMKMSGADAFLSPHKRCPDIPNIKKYTVLYDVIPTIMAEKHPESKQGSIYSTLVETLNGNDYYFAISESTRQDFLKYFPQIDENKIYTTLLACADSFRPTTDEQIKQVKAKYNIPQDKKYVFSLCTLEPRKNLIRAVKTFIEFIKKNNIEDLVFVLGGGHWKLFIDKLEQEIHNLGEYEDKIIKIGYVDDEDLPSLYSGAEWFTYTSQYEGFGLPPLEAMSCGCPVITSDNSSLPEVVNNSGLMIKYDSDSEHIEAYEKYYYKPELREEYSKKGLENAKQFSWTKCVDKMIDIMQKNR